MAKSRCVALEWGMADGNSKDYVPCDNSEAEPCRLVGLLLAVDADLCQGHQKYFASGPKGWGLVKVIDAKTGYRIKFWAYHGRVLTAEKEEKPDA